MPRIKLKPEPPRINHPELVDELASELATDREFGQPLVIEEPFGGTNDLRITVYWDRFDAVPDEERTRIILEAYQRVAASDAARIAVAVGITFAEGEDEWMLPYEVVPNLREGDPVSLKTCREVMSRLGASTLRSSNTPMLRFPTAELAQQAVRQLTKLLPGTDGLWTILGHMRSAG
jgi:hypothetical protein